MPNTEQAFKWIVGILQEKQIPFQITGGFAARLYGSKRELNDIDIDIPDDDFPKIAGDIKKYVTHPLERYIDERWDCLLTTLNYKGQVIDISGADTMRICDARTGEWKHCPSDLSQAGFMTVFGIKVPVVSPKDLIAYKSMLTGTHQKEDINAISTYTL